MIFCINIHWMVWHVVAGWRRTRDWSWRTTRDISGPIWGCPTVGSARDTLRLCGTGNAAALFVAFIAFTFHCSKQSAFPRTYVAIFFQHLPLHQSRHYDVTDPLFCEKAVNKFIHKHQGITGWKNSSAVWVWGEQLLWLPIFRSRSFL